MDDDLGPLRESARSPSLGEVCLEVCWHHTRDARAGTPLFAALFSLPSSIFLAQMDLRFEILYVRFEI